jgi:transposase
MRPHGTAKQLEQRRRQAIALLRAGRTYRFVAETLKASLSSVVRWYQAYRKRGLKELRARPTPGRPPRLSAKQRERLERLLLAGAVTAGYSTDLWTLQRIAKLVEEHFGVRYTTVGVWKLLRTDLEWSWQKPQRRATQRDDAAIEQWKRKRWPHIKKRPEAWGPSRIPRRKRVSAHP